MRKIKFSEGREFVYDGKPAKHVAGDEVDTHEDGEEARRLGGSSIVSSLRKDKAQRWVSRGAAAWMTEAEMAEREAEKADRRRTAEAERQAAAELADKERAEKAAADEARKLEQTATPKQEPANGNPVASAPAVVDGQDGGDSGQRPVNVSKRGTGSPAGKTAGNHDK